MALPNSKPVAEEAPPLYVWLDADPRVDEPDTAIEDVPGIADLELVYAALLAGRFGRYLPAKMAISPHRRPSGTAVRRIDVGRLLRDRAIPHRQRFELLDQPDDGADP